jgi:predicted dehydrogenase
MNRTGPVGIGFVGTGMISDTYLEHLTSFPDVRVLILGDLDLQRAQAQAEKYGVAEWGGTDEVLAHPEVELIVNLTIPAAHAQVASAAIANGKHVWSEKPISIDLASARALLDQARAAGLLVGVAPDTVLGPGLQTARRVIARGDIGVPLSAHTVIQYPGRTSSIPIQSSCSRRGPGRCTTWGRTTSPRWSTSSGHSPGLLPSARRGAPPALSKSATGSAPSSLLRSQPTSVR